MSPESVESCERLEHVVSPGEVERTLVPEASRLSSVVVRRCRDTNDERVKKDEEDRLENSGR